MTNSKTFQSKITCKCNGKEYVFVSNALSLSVETKKVVPKITYYTGKNKGAHTPSSCFTKCDIIYLALLLGL